MARPRAELHAILKDVLGTDHVYFQPPPSVAMVYPCIVYNRDLSQTDYADNVPYAYTQRYQVTVIDKNPDGVIREKVAALPQTLYIRFYAADNLNHDVFNLFF